MYPKSTSHWWALLLPLVDKYILVQEHPASVLGGGKERQGDSKLHQIRIDCILETRLGPAVCAQRCSKPVLLLIWANMTFNSSGSNDVHNVKLPTRRHLQSTFFPSVSSALSRESEWLLGLFQLHLTQDDFGEEQNNWWWKNCCLPSRA